MSEDKLVKKCKDIVKASVSEIVTVDNIKSFLDIVALFPFLSHENQILIWKQKRDATLIHGAKAWEKLGRNVKAEEGKIALLLPQICLTKPGEFEKDSDGTVAVDAKNNDIPVYKTLPVFEGAYKVVPVYDISQTEGQDIDQETKEYNFEPGIKKHGKGLVIEEASAQDMGSDKQSIDVPDPSEEAGTIYLLNSLEGQERNRELVNAYADRFIRYWKTTPQNAKELLFCVQYVLQKHFFGESKQRMFGVLKGLSAKDNNTKAKFLQDVGDYSARFIEELTDNACLSFSQTSFANCVLDTEIKQDMFSTFFTAMRFLDRDIGGEYKVFCSKMQRSKAENIKEIYTKKINRELFFEPPYILDTEEGGV